MTKNSNNRNSQKMTKNPQIKPKNTKTNKRKIIPQTAKIFEMGHAAPYPSELTANL